MKKNDNITKLKGVGEKSAECFSNLNINTLEDLVFYYPRSYDKLPSLDELKSANGRSAFFVCIKKLLHMKKAGSLSIISFLAGDFSGEVRLTFFNMPYLRNQLKPGSWYVFLGEVNKKGNTLYCDQPKIYTKEQYEELSKTLIPKYRLTKGLTGNAISKHMRNALSELTFEEFYPEDFCDLFGLSSIEEALQKIHFPVDNNDLAFAKERLAFDEFLYFLYDCRKSKEYAAKLPNTAKMYETAESAAFVGKLPFELTKAQKRVFGEIKDDLGGDYSCNRLIQGDVGSGKTIVAIMALLICITNGYQGALMAPTEVLAAQHFEYINKLTDEFGLSFRPALLTGSTKASEKKKIYEGLKTGDINLVIGTHALIQSKVEYKCLKMVICDEQHRFGVKQREALSGKGNNPHVISMSATPIPRSLALILYSDMNISVMDELPAERLPIKNCVVNGDYRPKAYEFIEKRIAEGEQAYVICPMIDEDDDLESVEIYSEKLKEAMGENVRVVSLHGKMKAEKKKEILDMFSRGEADVLVSTTVIEVGINVVNATVMLIENADNFGLASLHQLRGRIGRGSKQGYCIFINTSDEEKAAERLSILNNSNDGFYIASKDLEMRGPGEILGVKQSGDLSFEIADVFSDTESLYKAKEALEYILAEDPTLSSDKYKKLSEHFEVLKQKQL